MYQLHEKQNYLFIYCIKKLKKITIDLEKFNLTLLLISLISQITDSLNTSIIQNIRCLSCELLIVIGVIPSISLRLFSLTWHS